MVWRGAQNYKETAKIKCAGMIVRSVQNMQASLLDAAIACGALASTCPRNRTWDNRQLKMLRERRRLCQNPQERSILSKQIWTLTRRALRKWQTQKLCIQ